MGPMLRAWVNIGQVDFIVNKFSDILLVHISHLYEEGLMANSQTANA